MVLKHFISIVIPFTISNPFIYHFNTPKELPTIFTPFIYLPFIAQMDFKWYIVEPFFFRNG